MKETTTIHRKVHPQISQISADDFSSEVYSICENLRNLWINPFLNKRHVVYDLRVGAEGILCAARKSQSIVMRIRGNTLKIRVSSVASFPIGVYMRRADFALRSAARVV
jgi:hypothetical protein